MSDERVLPCPFCGGEAAIQSFTHDHRVYCKECEASTRKFYPTSEKAIKAWNTRKPMERIVEQLEEAKEFYRGQWNRYLDDEDYGELDAYEDAIKIVKRGGVDG